MKSKKLFFSTKMVLLRPTLCNEKFRAYLETSSGNFQICDSHALGEILRNYNSMPFSGILPKTPL